MKDHKQEAVLILSDINMPGMSGLELLKHIKEKYEKPPPVVMMITAYGDQENYRQAMQLGADDFLTKPVDFTALKGKLKSRFF
jgi:CheY-like chemotaxis protein